MGSNEKFVIKYLFPYLLQIKNDSRIDICFV